MLHSIEAQIPLRVRLLIFEVSVDYRRILVANTIIANLRAHTKSSNCGGHPAGCCGGYGLFLCTMG